MRNSITIERDIDAPINRVFEALVTPTDLMKWHNAGDGWQTPYAQVDPKVGGEMKIAYADPEGNVVFDFQAVIEVVDAPNKLYYRLGIPELIKDDSRLVTIDLTEKNVSTNIRIELDLEEINDKELQRAGWTQHVDNLEKLLTQ